MQHHRIILAVLVAALLGVISAPAHAAGANFVTPGLAAYCTTDEYTGSHLVCWTPNDGFTTHMTSYGRSTKWYDVDNRDYYTHARVLRFGRTWIGNGFACTSRSSGLTCVNRRGHGWWLGRYVGYRMF